jgi:hypothetical protein
VKNAKFYRIIGFILIVISVIGFFTVADEFRHMGELICVSGVLLAGIFLVTAGFQNLVTRHFAFQWVPVGIASGLLLGAVMDDMLAGIFTGIFTGLLIAFLKRPKLIK